MRGPPDTDEPSLERALWDPGALERALRGVPPAALLREAQRQAQRAQRLLQPPPTPTQRPPLHASIAGQRTRSALWSPQAGARPHARPPGLWIPRHHPGPALSRRQQLAILRLAHPWLDELDPQLVRHLLLASLSPPTPRWAALDRSPLSAWAGPEPAAWAGPERSPLAAWVDQLLLRPHVEPPPPGRVPRHSIAHLLHDALLEAAAATPSAELWSSASAPLPPPDATPCPLSVELLPLSANAWRAAGPWRVEAGSWGSTQLASLERLLTWLWLFTSDPLVIAPEVRWRPPPDPPPDPSLDELADVLADDLADEEAWRAYAAQLRQLDDPYAPLVEAGLDGQSLEPALEGRKDRGRLLGDLPRLGQLDSVRWDRGVAVTLDGASPPLWVSGVLQPTTFAFLRLTVLHLRPALFRSLVLLPPIRTLRLHSGTLAELDLHRLDALGPLVALELEGVTVHTLAPLRAHPTLRRLSLHTWWGTPDLVPLVQLAQLRSLSLIDCPSIVDLSSCARLTQLTELILGRSAEISDLSPLARLQQLRTLTLDGLDAVDDLSALRQLTRLVHLTLGYTTASDLEPLAGLQQLQTLTIQRGHRIRDLAPLTRCHALRQLTLDQCSSLEALPGLDELPQLRSLALIRCRRLRALPGAGDDPALESLTIFGCTSIEGFGLLPKLKRLVSLRIGLTPITDLSPLFALPALQIVTLLDPQPDPQLLASLRRAEPWSLQVEDGLWVARFDPRLPDPDPPGPERDIADVIEANTRPRDPPGVTAPPEAPPPPADIVSSPPDLPATHPRPTTR